MPVSPLINPVLVLEFFVGVSPPPLLRKGSFKQNPLVNYPNCAAGAVGLKAARENGRLSLGTGRAQRLGPSTGSFS